MNQRMLVIMLAAGGLLLGSGAAAAQATAPVPTEGTPAPNITKQQREEMKSEAAAKRAAKAKMTPEQKKAANAEKQKELDTAISECESDSRAGLATPEQTAKLKADAAAAKAARAKMTPAERKALNADKQKALLECEKAGG